MDNNEILSIYVLVTIMTQFINVEIQRGICSMYIIIIVATMLEEI